MAAYRSIGAALASFTHGRLPKAMRLLPRLRAWEAAAAAAEPTGWTPQAWLSVTRTFAVGSASPDAVVQRYYTTLLWPMVRAAAANSMGEGKQKVHPDVYAALRAATRRPAPFFRGLVLHAAAATSPPCSAKEAAIIGHVLKLCSFPAVHAAAALHQLASAPLSRPALVFVQALLAKRYALPAAAVDVVGARLHSAMKLPPRPPLPLLWHQTFLTFAKGYAGQLSQPQIVALQAVVDKHTHHLLTSEIRSALAHPTDAGPAQADGDAML